MDIGNVRSMLADKGRWHEVVHVRDPVMRGYIGDHIMRVFGLHEFILCIFHKIKLEHVDPQTVIYWFREVVRDMEPFGSEEYHQFVIHDVLDPLCKKGYRCFEGQEPPRGLLNGALGNFVVSDFLLDFCQFKDRAGKTKRSRAAEYHIPIMAQVIERDFESVYGFHARRVRESRGLSLDERIALINNKDRVETIDCYERALKYNLIKTFLEREF